MNPDESAQPTATDIFDAFAPEREALLAALTAPDDLREQWRENFNEIVASVKTLLCRFSDQLTIQAHADSLSWLYLSATNEPLPATLQADVTPGHITPLGAIQIFGRVTPDSNVVTRYLSNKLQSVNEAQEAFSEGRRQHINVALEGFIRKSPQYRFLKSLLAPKPIVRERPLDMVARLRRESDIRRLFRLDESAAAHLRGKDPRMHDALQRQLSRLNTESMRALPKESFLPQLHAWLLHRATEWFDAVDESRSRPVVKVWAEPEQVRDDETGALITGSAIFARTSEGKRARVTQAVRTWSRDWKRTTTNDPFMTYEMAEYLPATFVQKVLEQGEEKARICLEEAVVEEASTHAHQLLFRNLAAMMATLKIGETPLATWWPPPIGTIPDFLEGNYRATRVADLEQSLTDEQETKGKVLRHTHRERGFRVIANQPLTKSYPTSRLAFRRAELVIEFADRAFLPGHEPVIPGFEITANKGTQWAFRRTTTDPYAGADRVDISPAGLERLASGYRDIGLTELAAELTACQQNAEPVSISRLQTLVATHSRYTFLASDESLSNQSGLPAIEDFRHCIRNGKLNVQCNGAANFLGASLELAFPGGTAGTIGGLALGPADRITANEHAQTAFCHEGFLYILDATPFELMPAEFAMRQQALASIAPPEPRDPQPAQDLAPPRPPRLATRLGPTVRQAIAHDLAKESSASVRAELEELLQSFLDTPNKTALYRKVQQLPPADLIRQALEAAAQPDNVSPADVVRYLDNYVAGDATLRGRVSPRAGAYDPAMIELVAQCLRPLVAAPPPASQRPSPAEIGQPTGVTSPSPRPTSSNRGQSARHQWHPPA